MISEKKEFFDKINKIVDSHEKNFINYLESTGDLSFNSQMALSLIIDKYRNIEGILTDKNNYYSYPIYFINGFDEEKNDEVIVFYECFKLNENKEKEHHTRLYFWKELSKYSKTKDFIEVKNKCICLGNVFNPNLFENKTKNLMFNLFNFRPQITYIKI